VTSVFGRLGGAVVARRHSRSLDHMLCEIYERDHDKITTDKHD
jgi:hypothetical protein